MLCRIIDLGRSTLSSSDRSAFAGKRGWPTNDKVFLVRGNGLIHSSQIVALQYRGHCDSFTRRVCEDSPLSGIAKNMCLRHEVGAAFTTTLDTP